jgi:hypothetical protein
MAALSLPGESLGRGGANMGIERVVAEDGWGIGPLLLAGGGEKGSRVGKAMAAGGLPCVRY